MTNDWTPIPMRVTLGEIAEKLGNGLIVVRYSTVLAHHQLTGQVRAHLIIEWRKA